MKAPGVVNLEPGSVVGDLGVSRGVGFVEAIGRELFHQVEDFVGLFLGDVVSRGTLDEDRTLLGHGLGFFLAHGAPQQVSAAQRVVGDDLGDLHDLFLVDNDAVGILEAAFQRRVRVNDGYFTMLALDEFVDHARAKRPGAVEGEHGYEIFEAGGVQHAQVLTHTGSFDLEDTVRISAGIEVVSGLIREGQDIEIRRLLTLQFDVIQGVLNKRHGLEAEKVEFDKARLLDHGAVKLGDLLAVFAPEEGEVLDHWLVRNHKSAACMLACRVRPSSFMAMSRRCLICGSVS